MSLTPRLDLRQSQSLTMTPRLQQAIKLLQMSSLELESVVAEELERNPFLEREGENDSDNFENSIEDSDFIGREELNTVVDKVDSQIEPEIDTNDIPTEDSFYEQADYDGSDQSFDFSMDSWSGAGAKGESDDSFSVVDLCQAHAASLFQSLLSQIQIAFTNAQDRKIAAGMLDKLDESGYLIADLTPDESRLLPVLQNFYPTGIFARSLSECLALQLREKNRFDPAMEKMLEHLDLIGLKEYKKLMKICGVDEEDIIEMISEIKRLDPKPATSVQEQVASTLIPDVLLRQDKFGNFIVELNQSVLPRVLINRSYTAEISAISGTDKHAKKFINEHLSAASWLIKALNQRAETILKVATEIVERQKDFFKYGETALKPMILKDIAEAVEMHESTVSRVTQQKYIASARGIFELKYFFSQSIANGSEEGCSSQAIKGRIKSLVESEKPEKILSDDALVLLLKQEGIEIARRTVAKYRESIGIPTSAQRKRDKRLILNSK